MIAVTLTNNILQDILAIESSRISFKADHILPDISLRMRKNSKKKSSHASTRIEGNPLTEEQSNKAIDDGHRHFLKPEEEVRNYYSALEFLESRLDSKSPVDMELLLETQEQVVSGVGQEKIAHINAEKLLGL